MCILIVVNDFIMICNSSLQRIPFLTSCCANSLVFYHFTFRVEKYCCFFHKMTVYLRALVYPLYTFSKMTGVNGILHCSCR